jgi:hypothetical protein
LTDFNVKVEHFVPALTIATAADLNRVTAQNILDKPIPAICCIVLLLLFAVAYPVVRRRDERVSMTEHLRTKEELKAKEAAEDETMTHMTWWEAFRFKARYRLLPMVLYRHMWLGILFPRPSARTSGRERLLVVACLVFGTMTISAFFFGHAQQSVTKLIGVAIVSSIVTLPVRMIAYLFFQKPLTYAEHQKKKQSAEYGPTENQPEKEAKEWARPRNSMGEGQRSSQKVVPISHAQTPVLVFKPRGNDAERSSPQDAKSKETTSSDRQSPAAPPKFRIEIDVNREAKEDRTEKDPNKEFHFPFWVRKLGVVCSFLWLCACIFSIVLYGLRFDMTETPLQDEASANGDNSIQLMYIDTTKYVVYSRDDELTSYQGAGLVCFFRGKEVISDSNVMQQQGPFGI